MNLYLFAAIWMVVGVIIGAFMGMFIYASSVDIDNEQRRNYVTEE